MSYTLERSRAKNKKWTITDKLTGKKIHFGDSRFEDYTQHGDPIRKALYISRHSPRENWSDRTTAGFWAKHLLWNKPTIEAGIGDLQKRFAIKISRL